MNKFEYVRVGKVGTLYKDEAEALYSGTPCGQNDWLMEK